MATERVTYGGKTAAALRAENERLRAAMEEAREPVKWVCGILDAAITVNDNYVAEPEIAHEAIGKARKALGIEEPTCPES